MVTSLERKIDQDRARMLEFTQELVRIPSISGTLQEGEAQEVAIGELKTIRGLVLDVWNPTLKEVNEYPLHPIRTTKWSYEGRPNVVGVLKGTGGGSSLILNGHIDVVSPEPVSAWKKEPWGGERVGGRIYGRGSMDMKGGLAAMIFAVRSIAECGVRPRGDVILQSVVEEEFGGGGTVAAVVRGYKADAAIITEATSSDSVCIASGGSRFFNIRIIGKPEWPHLAHHGVNAIALTSKVYRSLIRLDTERYHRLKGRHPLMESYRAGGGKGPGRPTNMTVGTLTAGDWPATVAGWAEMKGRVGFPPSEKGQDVQREVEESVRRAAEAVPWMREHQPTVEWWGARREGYELSPDEDIVRALSRNVESVLGRCSLYGSSSASDASYLVPRVGRYGGIPTVWYGPGGQGAHTFDEYVLADEIVETAKVLARTIVDWCGTGTSGRPCRRSVGRLSSA